MTQVRSAPRRDESRCRVSCNADDEADNINRWNPVGAQEDADATAWQNNICVKYLLALIWNSNRFKALIDESISYSGKPTTITTLGGANLIDIKRLDESSSRCLIESAKNLDGPNDGRDGTSLDAIQSESSSKTIIPNKKVPLNTARTYQEKQVQVKDITFQAGNLSPYKRLAIVALNILLINCINESPSCHGFSLFERGYDNVDFNYPLGHQSNIYTTNGNQHRSLTFPLWSQLNNRYARQTNGDTMSTLFGSTSLDQSGSQQNNPPAHTWTSIFNPFGSNSNTNQDTNNAPSPNDSLDKHIRNILVPRVSGTPGNIQVRQYIVDVLKQNNYHTELDEFTDSTPIGNVKFANIIATSNPRACRQLVLACHYDSKMMDGFLGATDSAVPCAMLLKLAETFKNSYKASDTTTTTESNDIGLKFIFFDGEEAYVQWSRSDSLYGSRHLAAKWAKQVAPDECQTGHSGSKKQTELDRIDLFVLLDLIGTSSTSFVQYSSSVRHHYEALQRHEKDHIVRQRPDASQAQIKREAAFKNKMLGLDLVEDDHVPFKQRGVPILLLLAHPFPRVWHTIEDNYNAIDFARTRRIQYALEKFVANYS